jgi:hypothetical protein
MNIGFTGTQRGMSDAQLLALRTLLTGLQGEKDPVVLHHGDCVGADEQAHAIAMELKCKIIVYPPDIPDKRAYCPMADRIYPVKPYLDRDHDIVKACDVMVACPQQRSEIKRSGTWATIRYARKLGKELIIILPDGASIRQEPRDIPESGGA